MKKICTVLAALLVAASAIIPTAAIEPVEGIENCYFHYDCYKSVNPVTADGVYNEAEWSDAAEFTVNADTMGEYSTWASPKTTPANELSCTYKLKWDEKYLYFLEIRTDAHYVADFGTNSYSAQDPWNCDGTAFYFCDSWLLDAGNRCDIKYFPYVNELKGASIYIGNYADGGDAFTGPSGTNDCTYGGTLNGNTTVFELKMPWDIMRDLFHLDSEIKEGTQFRFSPIIASRDSAAEYNAWDGNSSFRQINFHDCVGIEGVGAPGTEEDPNYYAAMTLTVGAPTEVAPAEEEPVAEEPVVEEAVVEEPVVEEVVEAPAVEEAPVVTAPQTFDAAIIAGVAAVVSLAGYALNKKR